MRCVSSAGSSSAVSIVGRVELGTDGTAVLSCSAVFHRRVETVRGCAADSTIRAHCAACAGLP